MTVVDQGAHRMKILAFLPRRNLQSRIERALGSSQCVVETAASVKDCMELAQAKSFEGIVVDSDSLLFGDVLALVAFLRHSNSEVALFVCARYLDLEQRMRLFEVGADDYVNEPFFASEMAMRLRHSIRLRQAASGASTASRVNVLRSGDLELDLVRRQAVRSGKTITLRPKEFLLLEYLVRNEHRPVTRTMILEHVWNSSFEGSTNVVDVCISALRNKVDRTFPWKLIRTNRGIGYTFMGTNDSRQHNLPAPTKPE
jgi:two-component system, OmpR family, response regulator